MLRGKVRHQAGLQQLSHKMSQVSACRDSFAVDRDSFKQAGWQDSQLDGAVEPQQPLGAAAVGTALPLPGCDVNRLQAA